jgi:hypothetical protein
MLHFQLFRIKVVAPGQKSLFDSEFSPQVALVETLRKKPAGELRIGYTWHVGNISDLDESGMYFALGRTTRSTVEMYDPTSGNFVEAEFETAPYTHVICDTSLEVCGIARKSRLAQTAAGIARQLQNLLNASTSESTRWRFEVSAISDPEEFIAQLRAAYVVTRFGLTFTLPNPFDVNKDFQEPMERLLRDADGQRGKTLLNGKDLDTDVLEELARSAAATGNDAEATIKRTANSKPARRRLAGDVASITEKDIGSDSDRKGILDEIRGLYARIRGSTDK